MSCMVGGAWHSVCMKEGWRNYKKAIIEAEE